jgi:hypothetical protein
VAFVFASIDVTHYIYRFAYVEPSLHPWDETNLVMVNDLSDILLDSVYHYFIEDFYTNVHQGDWPVALFFGCVLVWFWDVYNTGFIE